MDDRSHAEALRRFIGKPPALRGLPFTRDTMRQRIIDRVKIAGLRNGVSRYQVVTSASLRCSICFLTLTGNACSASRSS